MQTINERITELMKDSNYDPLERDNFAESMANIERDQAEILACMLRNKQYGSAGLLIEKISCDIWRKLAKTQAEADEEREHLAACERCHGEGCSSCNDKDDDRREGNE